MMFKSVVLTILPGVAAVDPSATQMLSGNLTAS